MDYIKDAIIEMKVVLLYTYIIKIHSNRPIVQNEFEYKDKQAILNELKKSFKKSELCRKE